MLALTPTRNPGSAAASGGWGVGKHHHTILSKFQKNCMKSKKLWAVEPPLIIYKPTKCSYFCNLHNFFQRLQQKAEPSLVSEDAGSAHAPGVLIEILCGDR